MMADLEQVGDGAAVAAECSPVLALSLHERLPQHCRATRSNRILVAVRDSETNATHPNVISVPTMRLPVSLFDALAATAAPVDHCGPTVFYEGLVVESVATSSHHPVVHAVAGIMSRKLGLAEPLERGCVRFRAALRVVMVGRSAYLTGHDCVRTEAIRMANVVVSIDSGAELIPQRTASYSRIAWLPVERFIYAVSEKDPLVLGLDPVQHCIHGLCVATSHDLLARDFGLPSLGGLPSSAKGDPLPQE